MTSAISDVPGLITARPTFEDFVYYATAQREVERIQDGMKYVYLASNAQTIAAIELD
jgi:hypothetical protein